ncbi:MAG: endonuclease/exonuclease/phosphatase family protein [Spirochaetales bacterium]|nr:endonuclease/exonuclease/phosphatase family protein [Spirochaetales bacterium]
MKLVGKIAGGFVALIVVLFAWMYFSSYVPPDHIEEEVVCHADAPAMKAGQKLKVLNWNVQYLASKNYVFFYDLSDGSGPDIFPSREHIEATLGEIVRVIKDEKPDIVLLQELHENARQTYRQDQLQLLVDRLADEYPCYADSLYWKAPFVPHPKIMGSVGMKLGTLSKYRMTRAERQALPPIPADLLSERLGFHRAILTTYHPVDGGKEFAALNTHMDAFSQGTNVMDEQVAIAIRVAEALETAGNPWVMGGDFNLLPPGWDRKQLHQDVWDYYNDRTEIEPLFAKFPSTATVADLNGPRQAAFYTHFPNNPKIKRLDRTIDYMFYSPRVKKQSYYVRTDDAKHISDHMPMIGEFLLP